MIVMRGIHHGFLFQVAVGARQQGDDVIGLKVADLADHVRLKLRAQIHGMEIPRARIRHHLVEIHSRGSRQFLSHIEMYP